jgi:hypothetical protein
MTLKGYFNIQLAQVYLQFKQCFTIYPKLQPNQYSKKL